MDRISELAATVRQARAKGMEALAADVHPYSATAVRDWEEAHEEALTALEAIARDGQRAGIQAQDFELIAHEAATRTQEAEAERDRLQHIIDCADTPLMRDVLAENQQLRRELQDIADSGCENVTNDMRECVETKRDRTNWCWPCIARAALLTEQDLAGIRQDARAALSLSGSRGSRPEPAETRRGPLAGEETPAAFPADTEGGADE